MSPKTIRRLVVFSVLAILIFVFVYWTIQENSVLELTSYTVKSDRLPKAFEGYRIAQVSDLHNEQWGEENETLLAKLREADPDLIALTGDLIDFRDTKLDVALNFAEKAMQIAPCYFVTGNHESRIDGFTELKNGLVALGVVVLEDQSVQIEKDGASITVIGVNDPAFRTSDLFGDSANVLEKQLRNLKKDDSFTVLLSHRPEVFDVYASFGLDLVLSGHTHAGQFRLPYFGGVYAPNQGFFPEYDAGLFTKDQTNMIVSRGAGNSLIPFRINNKAEIVIIELTK